MPGALLDDLGDVLRMTRQLQMSRQTPDSCKAQAGREDAKKATAGTATARRIRGTAVARALIVVGALTAQAADGWAQAPTADEVAAYVGREVCASCHEAETMLWRGWHHDLAMQEATAQTVLGDFDDASFTHGDVTSCFFRRDGGFFVNTDGPDGELDDFEIRYTFGVYPLQQYLIAFPDGRLQALGIA